MRRLCSGLGLALAFAARSVGACPCSDDAGSASTLVRSDERYAVALVLTARAARGRFDALGRYHALSTREAESSEELLLRIGVRLPRRLEWLAELGAANYRFHAPHVVEGKAGPGDVLFHARYSLLDESMPHAPWPLPALALSALLRAPLGTSFEQRSSGFGSGGAQLGLGAWELGAGLELSRAILPRLDVLLGAEGAYRLEDRQLGVPRRMGPRVDAALAARVTAASWLSTSLALRTRSVGNVTLRGDVVPGTAEQAWGVVLGAALLEPRRRLRSTMALSLDAPYGAWSRNATAATALSVGLAYGWD